MYSTEWEKKPINSKEAPQSEPIADELIKVSNKRDALRI